MLTGKHIVIGMTGGIACYKVCSLVSSLRKLHAEVKVVMTQHATEFVAPLTMESLSANRVIVDMFDRDFPWEIEHISLAKWADVFVICPATANFIAKYASGIADDFLSTTVLATRAPMLVCPAMNTNMLLHSATQQNIQTLESRNVVLLYGGCGVLACGDEGAGRMAEPETILEQIVQMVLPKQDLIGCRILITAGGTSEDIDGVRCISNYSSGKMGLALVRAAKRRGAFVTLVAAQITTAITTQPDRVIRVKSTNEMYDVCMQEWTSHDIAIKAAAPSDYRVKERRSQKIKSETLTLELEKNPDIAAAMGAVKRKNQTLVIFCAETEKLIESAKKKLIKKNADLVVANDLTIDGAGFGTDTNIASILSKTARLDSGKVDKIELAELILDEILSLRKGIA